MYFSYLGMYCSHSVFVYVARIDCINSEILMCSCVFNKLYICVLLRLFGWKKLEICRFRYTTQNARYPQYSLQSSILQLLLTWLYQHLKMPLLFSLIFFLWPAPFFLKLDLFYINYTVSSQAAAYGCVLWGKYPMEYRILV